MSVEKKLPWLRLPRPYKVRPGQQTWPLPTIREESSEEYHNMSIDQKLDKISRVISRFEETLRMCGFSKEEVRGLVESESLEKYFNQKIEKHLKIRKLHCYCHFRKKVLSYGHYVYYFRLFRVSGIPFQLFCDFIDNVRYCLCSEECKYCKKS